MPLTKSLSFRALSRLSVLTVFTVAGFATALDIAFTETAQASSKRGTYLNSTTQFRTKSRVFHNGNRFKGSKKYSGHKGYSRYNGYNGYRGNSGYNGYRYKAKNVFRHSGTRKSGVYSSFNQPRVFKPVIPQNSGATIFATPDGSQFRLFGDRPVGNLGFEDEAIGGVILDGPSADGRFGPSGREFCPKGYNCGYRYYQDGTGPRIIRLGQKPGKDLPEYDPVDGPAIIRLGD